jgi:hypothetical protein
VTTSLSWRYEVAGYLQYPWSFGLNSLIQSLTGQCLFWRHHSVKRFSELRSFFREVRRLTCAFPWRSWPQRNSNPRNSKPSCSDCPRSNDPREPHPGGSSVWASDSLTSSPSALTVLTGLYQALVRAGSPAVYVIPVYASMVSFSS